MTKIELLYMLYRFGCKRQIASLHPFVVFPIDNLTIPLSFDDFKVAFEEMCKKLNHTEDSFYEKVRWVIIFLVAHGQFNFKL